MIQWNSTGKTLLDGEDLAVDAVTVLTMALHSLKVCHLSLTLLNPSSMRQTADWEINRHTERKSLNKNLSAGEIVIAIFIMLCVE